MSPHPGQQQGGEETQASRGVQDSQLPRSGSGLTPALQLGFLRKVRVLGRPRAGARPCWLPRPRPGPSRLRALLRGSPQQRERKTPQAWRAARKL